MACLPATGAGAEDAGKTLYVWFALELTRIGWKRSDLRCVTNSPETLSMSRGRALGRSGSGEVAAP